jgi:6-phosphogluconolactonase
MPVRHLTSTLSGLFVAGVATLSVTAFGQAGRSSSGSGNVLVYFGTYTGEKSKGVYVSRLDLASGALSRPELAGETASPSFLAVHPSQNFLYAINEIGNFQGKASGSVSAFTIDRNTGRLTALNQQPSVGPGPAHLVVDKAGRNVLVANYGGGSVAVVPIGPDGMLKPPSAFIQHTGSSVDPQRQKGPHAHSINLDPANHIAYAADLGLDKVLLYRFDADKGSLVANDPPFAQVAAGAGPRHFAIHPNGFAYVINEMNMTVTAFRRDTERGSLTELQTISTLPPGQRVESTFSTADVQVHPSGRFLYGSNRGHDSIVVFAIDQSSGRLTYLENRPTQGSTPRGFGIDPRGQSAIGLSRRLQDRQADGTAHADRTHHRSRCAGLREIRRAAKSLS